MKNSQTRFRRQASLMFLAVCSFAILAVSALSLRAQTAQPAAAKAVGTVKAISGKTITLAVESGSEVTVAVQEGARLLRIEPGQTDLKAASPLPFEELQPGDRILVRGTTGADGKTLLAASVVAMKKADIAQKNAHEREQWQRQGIGGLVSEIDAQTGTISVSTSALGGNKNVTVHVSKDTVLRRYAPGSVKFEEAAPAPIDQIKVGDQLRARGARNGDGSELNADEIVSGSFHNISGTIGSIDTTAGIITVTDLATKKPVVIQINESSQLRKLPLPMAQRIAARVKGTAGAQPTGGGDGASQAQAAPASRSSEAPGERSAGGQSQGASGGGRGGQGGSNDLQQAIGRMPAAALADLQKGDAVMIVATGGQDNIVAITLLAGVEPILQASPSGSQSILTPWTMSGAPGGDAGAQ
jgi:hypothetical protein